MPRLIRAVINILILSLLILIYLGLPLNLLDRALNLGADRTLWGRNVQHSIPITGQEDNARITNTILNQSRRIGLKLDANSPKALQWTTQDKLVAAYYFYWYDYDDPNLIFTNHPPDEYLSDFSFRETNWHLRELKDMMAAQIDIVLPVYWGGEQNELWSKPGLQNLVKAANVLKAEGQEPPRIGMSLDTASLPDSNGGPPPDLTTDAGKAVFYGMMHDFFSIVPTDLWATINGQPIIFLWISQFASDYNQSTFDYVSQRFQADFGVAPYIIREQSWQGVETADVYGWGAAVGLTSITGGVASVGPGYDESKLPDRAGQVQDRKCGRFYADVWDIASNSSAYLVVVETWNEYHEASGVASSREYGRTYIDLTAHYANQWKLNNQNDYSSAQVLWADMGEVTYRKGVGPAFNFPDGKWGVTTINGREAAYSTNSSTPPSHFIWFAVNDSFIGTEPAEVWITVEYYDGGTDKWWLEYNSSSDIHAFASSVELEGSMQWKQHTFYLPDANFQNQQSLGSDFRLGDGLDGETNYFGRIWITRQAPTNTPPDLTGPTTAIASIGGTLNIPLTSVDADGDFISLDVINGTNFAKLITSQEGAATLQLAPKPSDYRSCPYFVTVLATDDGIPPMSDKHTIEIWIQPNEIYLPMISD